MDAARLQSKIYSGYGKAATRIGYPFTIYRPNTIGPAIDPDNIVGSLLNAAFTVGGASKFDFGKPSAYKNPLWYGLFDGTTTQVGDYLSDPVHGTYFIAAQQDQLPILCIGCSHSLTVLRPNGPSAIGLNAYSAVTPASETALLTAWPGSVLFDARGRSELAQLPMDNPAPFFMILLPHYAAVDIRASDVITDDNTPNRKYVVAASELTALGWRIMAQQALA